MDSEWCKYSHMFNPMFLYFQPHGQPTIDLEIPGSIPLEILLQRKIPKAPMIWVVDLAWGKGI